MARGRPAHPLGLARKKYSRHKAQAKFRNIDFELSFDEWYNWWLSNGIDKQTVTFSKQDTQRMCMCRYNDTGAYTLGNIYLATNTQNAQDMWKGTTPHNNSYENKLKKRYRWGNDLVNIKQLRELAGDKLAHVTHYLADEYDRKRAKEAQMLRNRLHREHGALRTRTEYPATDGAWYPTRKAAAEACGHNADWYKRRELAGVEGFQPRVTPTLEQYVLENSRYPDPIILEDI